MNTAIYPGTFDPITLGHLNIVQRGLHVFDRIIIAISHEADKKPLFTVEERLQMLKTLFSAESRVEIDQFKGLLVDFLKHKKVTTILRGIRTVEDFEYEYQMTNANKMLDPNVETVFMLTDGIYGHLSSTLIKEIALLGGNIKAMVPDVVTTHVQKKLQAMQNKPS